MSDPVAAAEHRRVVATLPPLFFASGATGLVYQTLWERELHLVFGTTTLAVATVLAAFMAGLAVGGWLAARFEDRVRRPVAAYGLLEVGIGVYAVAFPWLLAGVRGAYLALPAALDGLPLALVQLVLVGALLVVPTAAMGATLPLLARYATVSGAVAGDRVGRLYAVNTAGAVLGTWLAGFVLLPGLGRAVTTGLVAAANVGLGLVALGLARRAPDVERAREREDEPPAPHPRATRAVLVAAALAGFASLVYEVAWFRVLGLMLGASVYAFSTMLLAFLVGIAAGGRAGGPLADRLLARHGVDGVLRALVVVELGVAGTSLLMLHAFQEMPFWYVWLFDAFGAGRRPEATWIVSLLLAGLAMIPPALLMGAAFPLSVRAVAGGSDGVGRAVGRVYAVNTWGGVLGAAVAGFVLLPTLRVQGTVLLAAAVNVAAAGVALAGVRFAVPRRARLPVGLASAVVALGFAFPPAWDPLMMTAGMYTYVSAFGDHSRAGIRDYTLRNADLVFYEEGPSSVVTVARNTASGNLWLANNGKVDASTTLDMPTQVLVSLLPLQFVDAPRDGLVIGLASGITAGALARAPELRRIDVVEIEPSVARAARLFSPWNHDVLDDPRVRLIVADGRQHVLRSPPAAYDVVVSEPSNPWLTGVSNLFTREFFALGRTRVRPGGVWSQWIQLYGMDDEDLRSLLATFASVWPHVLVYEGADGADLVLLGSDRPMAPTLEAARRLTESPRVAAELDVIGLDTPWHVVATWHMDRAQLLRMAGDVELNTDDNARIEYRAPLRLHVDTQRRNVRLLAEHAQLPLGHLPDDPVLWADLAQAYRDVGEPGRAIDAQVRAALLEPPDEGLATLDAAFAWYVEDVLGREPTAAERARLQTAFRTDHVGRIAGLVTP